MGGQPLISVSLQFEAEDFEYIEQGALGRAYLSFGDNLYPLIDELNNVLVA